METFSLEDEDYGDLFITQSTNDDIDKESECESGILGDPLNFVSPCASVVNTVNVNTNAYSDISDDDDFQFPLSQVRNEARRYIISCLLKICNSFPVIVLLRLQDIYNYTGL